MRATLARLPFLPALLIALVLLAANGVLSPNAVGFRGLTGLVSTYLALMLIAVGQTYTVYAGDIDLSIGAVVSLVNVLVVTLMAGGDASATTVLLGMALGLGVGAGCGLVNGLIVAGLRLQPIVATFATGIVFTGLALSVMPVAGTPAPRLFWRTYGGRILDVPFVLWAAGLLALVLVVLARTRLAVQLLAVGDGQAAAYQTGLPVTAIRVRGYVLAGTFAALAAFCITGATASGDPLVGGAMTLSSVAAVVLGGSALAGGFGTALGSVFGALIIALIESLVYFAGTPSAWQNFTKGVAILLALMAGVVISRAARA